MISVKCDDDRCIVIKRFQGQGSGSIPIDEVSKDYDINTSIDQTQSTGRVKVNISLQDPQLLTILG